MRALLLLVLASCTHDITVFERVTVKPARELDILYVFDDSGDRGNYDKMASQLDVLQAKLRDVDGQMPSLHVGVATTDLGVRGRKDAIAGAPVLNCAGDGDAGRLVTFDNGRATPNGRFLEDLRAPDGARDRNFDSNDLSLELRRLTSPPATANTGCEFEQPLEAMRRALDPFNNPEFIRPNAMLSVIFLTTEDDCSFSKGSLLDPSDASLGPLSSFRCTEQGVVCDEPDPRKPGVRTNCRPREGSQYMIDVAEYKTFLDQYKTNPRDIVVASVAGARTPFEVRDIGVPTLFPSCQGPGGSARPAVRLGALVDSVGGVNIDGCTQDNAYEQIATPLVNRQRTCLPNVAADDIDCSVVEIVPGGMRTELARCADGSASQTLCWYTYTDAAVCPDGDNLGIGVRRGNTTAPANSRIEATCVVN